MLVTYLSLKFCSDGTGMGEWAGMPMTTRCQPIYHELGGVVTYFAPRTSIIPPPRIQHLRWGKAPGLGGGGEGDNPAASGILVLGPLLLLWDGGDCRRWVITMGCVANDSNTLDIKYNSKK